MIAGYSGTPLAKKLGIKDGSKVLVLSAPKDYAKLLAPLPATAAIVGKVPKGGADIVHLFVASLAQLDKQLPAARKAMTIDGAIWVSWIKKAAKIPTDVTEDLIRNRALKTDLVDVKVCAVSDIWSGLKLVVRKALR
ncbi:MAG: DUF3052 domain-containing protein [Proteobacteria bacterium]|nr:DUF3052 domain-containing protein [Pseudomonadota bacterium]